MDVLSRYRQSIKEEEALRMSNSNFATTKKLKADAPNIIRIVDPNSAVSYYEAWMVCDDGEKRPFVVENDHQGKGVLANLLGDRLNFYHGGILSSLKDENGNKYYEYEQADPELLLQVAYNNDKSNNSGNWRPTRRFAFNIIDREPETEGDLVGKLWCVENQHTKQLVVGTQAFEHLVDVRDNNGPLESYDINITKTGKGKLNTKYKAQKAGDIIPNVVFGDLTDEEKNYEKYDLKQEAALTSATEILKFLQNTIARIDRVLGTDSLQQLQQQALLETPNENTSVGLPAQNATTQMGVGAPAGNTGVNQTNIGRQAVQTPAPAQESPQPVATQVAPQTAPQVAPQPVQATPPQPQEPVTQAQPQATAPQPQVQPQQPVPEQPQAAAPAVNAQVGPQTHGAGTIECPICKQPTEIVNNKNCSKCNGVIMEPCDQCQTPFLITQNTCPSCGKVYQIVNN